MALAEVGGKRIELRLPVDVPKYLEAVAQGLMLLPEALAGKLSHLDSLKYKIPFINGIDPLVPSPFFDYFQANVNQRVTPFEEAANLHRAFDSKGGLESVGRRGLVDGHLFTSIDLLREPVHIKGKGYVDSPNTLFLMVTVFDDNGQPSETRQQRPKELFCKIKKGGVIFRSVSFTVRPGDLVNVMGFKRSPSRREEVITFPVNKNNVVAGMESVEITFHPFKPKAA